MVNNNDKFIFKLRINDESHVIKKAALFFFVQPKRLS